MILTDRIFEEEQAVEYLKFSMNPSLVDRFIELDRAVWTEALATRAGFVSKEVWINKKVPGEVTTILYWKSLKDWNDIDHKWLSEVEKRFQSYLGENSFTLTAVHEGNEFYRIRETVKDLSRS